MTRGGAHGVTQEKRARMQDVHERSVKVRLGVIIVNMDMKSCIYIKYDSKTVCSLGECVVVLVLLQLFVLQQSTFMCISDVRAVSICLYIPINEVLITLVTN